MTMNLSLKDIIDLEYLISRDDEQDSGQAVQACLNRDRGIYRQFTGDKQDRGALVRAWLSHRREQESPAVLPGTYWALLNRLTGYIMLIAGFLSGMSLTASILAYHGSRPINVTVFVAVFIVLPLLFTLFAALTGFRRLLGNRGSDGGSPFSIGFEMISTAMFKGLPKLLKRLGWGLPGKGSDTASNYTAMLVNMRTRTYQGLFYGPFFMLTCVFSLAFSLGTLGTTFFRVMVSDMAFGWQSTLLTSSRTVYDLVSAMAWPWAGWLPKGLAYPGIEQIEGSRIILKEGISVLATQDLVSWWPFLCLGIVFYALIPRAALMFATAFAQRRELARFDLRMPGISDVIARMTSPVLSVDIDETPVSTAAKSNRDNRPDKEIEPSPLPELGGRTCAMLVSGRVYSKQAVEDVKKGVEKDGISRVNMTLDISFDFEADRRIVESIEFETIDQVILIQEVWQPPIRGLLYYLSQLSDILPEKIGLQVFLTGDAGTPDLVVGDDDIDFHTWKKAVSGLGRPNIRTRRFM